MNTSRIAMTAAERSMGRLMRAPDHGSGDAGGGGSGDSSQGGDNSGGNGAPANGDSGTGDNNGQSFDASSFWNEPTPSGDNQQQQQQQSQNDSDPGREIGQQIAAGIKDYQFKPVFTQEIGEQLAEGNLDGANESFTNMARESMQQSVVMSAKIMEHLGTQMMAQFQSMIDQRLGTEKDTEALSREFQSMSDPAMRPVVEGVFKQAMKHSGNDRDKAMQLTRNMLKAMGQTGKQDMGIDDPAPDPDSFLGDGPSQLVKELMER